MKNKIGSAVCFDCGYPDCDVALDKNGHPYIVCWGDCDGEQYFTRGKKPKVERLLSVYRPLVGKPSAAELRAQLGIDAAPTPEVKPTPETKPAPEVKPKKSSGLLIED
jgi:hypothetical protein